MFSDKVKSKFCRYFYVSRIQSGVISQTTVFAIYVKTLHYIILHSRPNNNHNHRTTVSTLTALKSIKKCLHKNTGRYRLTKRTHPVGRSPRGKCICNICSSHGISLSITATFESTQVITAHLKPHRRAKEGATHSQHLL